MNCTACKKGELKKAKIDHILEIPGGPVLKIKGVPSLVCNKCEDELVDMVAAADINKKALSKLVLMHNHGSHLKGKTARWISKAIGFQTSEWEKYNTYSYDAFMKAVQRNSELDPLAALILIAKAVDFVTGTTTASKRIQEAMELDQLLAANSFELAEIERPKTKNTA